MLRGSVKPDWGSVIYRAASRAVAIEIRGLFVERDFWDHTCPKCERAKNQITEYGYISDRFPEKPYK